MEALAAERPALRLHTVYSRPRAVDRPGRDYVGKGRLDAGVVEKLVPGLRADFYLCGPTPFMAALQDGLEARGVPSERIHSESFGPRG